MTVILKTLDPQHPAGRCKGFFAFDQESRQRSAKKKYAKKPKTSKPKQSQHRRVLVMSGRLQKKQLSCLCDPKYSSVACREARFKQRTCREQRVSASPIAVLPAGTESFTEIYPYDDRAHGCRQRCCVLRQRNWTDFCVDGSWVSLKPSNLNPTPYSLCLLGSF